MEGDWGDQLRGKRLKVEFARINSKPMLLFKLSLPLAFTLIRTVFITIIVNFIIVIIGAVSLFT